MSIGKFFPFVLVVVGLAVYSYGSKDRVVEVVIPSPSFPSQASAASLPQKENEKWNALVQSALVQIDLDPSSLKVTPVSGAFTVQSRFRMHFFEEFDVEGAKEKGWYYVNTMTTNCTSKTMYVDESIVYSKTGVELARREDLGVLPKPSDPKSFVNVWAQVACADFQGMRVPVII